MTVPFFDATRQYSAIQKDITQAINRVLLLGKYVLGGEGISFENEFRTYIGTKYAIGVNSGTDAIKIALRSLSIGQNDEVITVTNTAVPTVSAIREVGAIPVFVDIDEFFTLDPKKIETSITDKTKAILIVHLYGQPANILAIKKIAKKHKIALIEDCAQATGASFEGKKVGTFGDMSCFSFYPTKNLGAYGDGGMILTNSKRLAERARSLRMYGMKKTYYAEEEGFNSRLDEIQATILRIKLQHLDTWNKKRKNIADFYNKNITNALIETPRVRNNSEHIFHLYVIRTKKRTALKKYLQENSIGCGVHYEYPIHQQPPYKKFAPKKYGLKESERVSTEILSLPIFPELTQDELIQVVKTLNNFKA
jgi:dTDP-4-amino-4,6-dideoxygalactose transaminase